MVRVSESRRHSPAETLDRAGVNALKREAPFAVEMGHLAVERIDLLLQPLDVRPERRVQSQLAGSDEAIAFARLRLGLTALAVELAAPRSERLSAIGGARDEGFSHFLKPLRRQHRLLQRRKDDFVQLAHGDGDALQMAAPDSNFFEHL
ncbi:MAG: hypothetical protein ABL957_10725 [Parvularculaceae bacterium]